MRLGRVPAAAGALLFFACVAVAVAGPAAHRTADASVTDARLKNGMRVIILRDPLAPVVSTFMNYRVGSDDESITGLAHAQEHMMFRGSKTLSASQFSAVTAITGGSFNADTQNAITQYFFTMPAQDLEIALRLDASRAQGILDTQALWNEERGAIEQEVTRDDSSASYRLYVKALHHVLAGTPYADEGLGTLDSFNHQVNAPQLQAFYRTWYRPNNAVYVIAGDVDPRRTLAEVNALFGKIPARPVPTPKPVVLRPLTPAAYTDVSDQATTEAFVAYRFPGYDSPDYAASQVLIDVLNSNRGALADLVASGKAVDASAQSSTFTHAGMAIVGTSVTADVSPQTALAEIRAVLAGYRRSGIPPGLIAAAKLREVAQAQSLRESISGLAGTWSQTIAVEGRTPDQDLALIRGVTAAGVNRVLRRYLVDATATTAYAVPKNAGAGGASAAVDTGLAGTTENNTVIPSARTALPSWSRGVLAHLRVPARTAVPVATTLPNGLRLIVQPERTANTVVVNGLIRNDPQVEEAPKTEGVASLTSALMSYGTTTYDRLAYQRELDKIAADVSTGLSFSLHVLTPQLDRGVQLLADGELHPAFPSAAFDVIKAREYRTVLEQAHSPDYLANVSVANALYPPGDPAQRFADATTVQALTLADVKAWYAHAYRPDLTTIVVVGDVTPAQARSVVARWFGDWHAAGPVPSVERAPVPDNSPAAFAIPATGRVQSAVYLSETLRLRRGDPDVAPLRVANAALSGGFYASILFHDLREVNGLVYTVGTSFDIGRTRSTFTVRYGSDPSNVDRAETLLLADLRRLQTAPLSSDRLRIAKALLVGSVPLREQSFDGIADQLLFYGSQGLPLDENLLEARRELAASAGDVQAAFAKWIRPGGFVRVVQGPATP